MRIFLISILCAFAIGCIYRNERYNDGDTWVTRSTFIMKCTIYKNGSWTAKVISCRTTGGVVVEPGQSLVEGDTKYDCIMMPDGHIEIKRTYYNSGRQQSCEGHGVGESWVSQRNFRKVCTENGARITECVTDAGFVVPLNSHLAFSGIIYKCTLYSNGTVSIDRETIPLLNNFRSRPDFVEVHGPLWKNFEHLGGLVQSIELPDNEPILRVHSDFPSSRSIPNEKSSVTCVSDGAVHYPGETWISNNKFTKKCASNGSIIILNCLIDGRIAVDVDTELKRGDTIYRCYHNGAERSVYLEVLPN